MFGGFSCILFLFTIRQPDALALGRSAEELRIQEPRLDASIVPHRTFPGNRPSISLLFPQLTAFTTGQMLSLYEHRTAVQGFVWDINSWDQWGVELGKGLATDIRSRILDARSAAAAGNPAAPATTNAARSNDVSNVDRNTGSDSDSSSDSSSDNDTGNSSGSESATTATSAAGVLPASVLATLNPSTQMLLTRYDSTSYLACTFSMRMLYCGLAIFIFHDMNSFAPM